MAWAEEEGEPSEVNEVLGFLSAERWEGVPNNKSLAEVLKSAAFLTGEPARSLIDKMDAQQDNGDAFLVRWRGTLVAPVTGDYRLFIASNDQSQLWFGGAGGSKFTRKMVASVDVATAFQAWNTSVTQDSGVIHLVAGEKYYIEVLMHDQSGADNLSVGWVKPGETAVEVIPGKLADGTVVLRSHAADPLDADDDGLLDSWEQTVGLNIGDNGRINSGDGAYADPDGDGVSNYLEQQTHGDPFAAGGNIGYVQRDIWKGISGNTVANLTSTAAFAKPASVSSMVSSSLSFGVYGDNYGQRIRGVIVPPRTGNWRFWISSDDASEFWLSSSDAVTDKRRIAYLSGATTPGNFDATPSQKSELKQLVAGTPYYFEVLHKDGIGTDHLRIAWACEDAVNWALASNGSTASQSSTLDVREASRAIDGNTSGVYAVNSTAHTNNLANSWWQVDFGQDRPVNRVVLFNRSDYQQRLSNFRVSVLDADGVELAGKNFFEGSGNAGASLAWDLPSTVTGRKVRVQLLGNNNEGNGFLALAEVQAYEWFAEANRQIVTAEHLRSATPDSLDSDGDSLPDTWESQYGLLAHDGGAGSVANGEYGDPDADGVPNIWEFINGSSPVAANGDVGKLARETWQAMPGQTIFDLVTSTAYLEPADQRDKVANWQFSNSGDYYGRRFRGTLKAPVTGWYTFWATGDNEVRLSLSSDSRKFLKQPIASVGDGNFAFAAQVTNPGNVDASFDAFPSQRSKPVYLVADSEYFFEVLHKESGGGDHVAVAWQVPGASRTPIPFSAFRSFTYDIDDADDDDLPDSWESQHGLDPADNGRIARGIEGALGDADGDQLSNREEFLLGTDPLNADTDGDGLSDYVETHSIGSDPKNANSGEGTEIVKLTGSQGSAVDGEWVAGPNHSLLSLNRRGCATWPFTLATDGAKLLEVLASPQGNTWAGAALTVEIAIVRESDSKRWPVGTFSLRDDEGVATRVLTLMPWLPAGSYRAEITMRNFSESRNIRVDSVRVIEPAGVDQDNNGVVDWVENRLGTENGLLSTAPESAISPVCLEGAARSLAATSLVAGGSPMTLEAGTDRHWFANIPLPADGSALPVTASFEDGWLSQDHSVTWKPTNIHDGATLTLRDGDALRLTSFPGATADQGAVAITGAGEAITTTADAPVVRTFQCPNWALSSLGSTASQSSTHHSNYAAEKAIDGNASSTTFSHTSNLVNSWWQVDFGQLREVSRITLVNRNVVQERLSNFRISVMDAADVELVGQNFYQGSGNVTDRLVWELDTPVNARKVKIQYLGRDNSNLGYLTLAEVLVHPRSSHTLAATHTDASGAVTESSMQVNVIDADFGDALAVRTDRWRDWIPDRVSTDLPLEFDASMRVTELAPAAGNYKLKVATSADKPVNIIARTAAAGSVAAKGVLDPYLIGDPYDTGYVEIIDTLASGIIHGRLTVVADRLPPGGYIEIQISAGGAQFADGTLIKRLYAADFDENGIAHIDLYYPNKAAMSALCASYRLKDANGTLLSGY